MQKEKAVGGRRSICFYDHNNDDNNDIDDDDADKVDAQCNGRITNAHAHTQHLNSY